MVEKTTLSRKIDVRLRSMRDHLDALPDYWKRFCVAADRASNVEFHAFEAEWRDTRDRFEWLHEQFEHGQLSPDQAVKHQQNLALLKKQMPVLIELDLAMPTGGLATYL